MEYIYGKLNKEVQVMSYQGKTTKTAQTLVDAATREISVNIPEKLILPDFPLDYQTRNYVLKIRNGQLAWVPEE